MWQGGSGWGEEHAGPLFSYWTRQMSVLLRRCDQHGANRGACFVLGTKVGSFPSLDAHEPLS
ncbi:hypothetical protein BAUCODRAFT_189816 [Baudoinia panamericana UAMH 10762]|uniref:Uncharacterized protein n=1 Tax=Baudoinia panamericana (strain UAMH 10762) TaxID=717646 RepID=M2N9P8_BAUPA|nr:uncharacterized protein BAUCODRAFT_189816 [Baudoinia panamericana UAMH 10762]EMD00924.1 hypothetical protein BAUCODRAFT_189816 [Baudoinia panamericana UAMH 10762]